MKAGGIDIVSTYVFWIHHEEIEGQFDWTERRPHLAGSLGSALLKMMFEENWLRRIPHTRAVQVTPKGRKALSAELKLEI